MEIGKTSSSNTNIQGLNNTELAQVADLISGGDPVLDDANDARPLVRQSPASGLLEDAEPVYMEGMTRLSIQQKNITINRKEVLQGIQHCAAPDLVSVDPDVATFPIGGSANHTLNGALLGTIFEDYDPSQPEHALGFLNRFSNAPADAQVPILGWELIVKQHDVRYAPGTVNIIGVHGSEVGTLARQNIVYNLTAQLSNISEQGRIVLVPLFKSMTYNINSEILGANATIGVKKTLTVSQRIDSYQIGVPITTPNFNADGLASPDSIHTFGFRLTGENVQVFVRPIFPSKNLLRCLGKHLILGKGGDYLRLMAKAY